MNTRLVGRGNPATGGRRAAVPTGAMDLVVTAGTAAQTLLRFDEAVEPVSFVVGAAPDADWTVMAPGVEPYHAELAWSGDALHVRDRGSVQGVFVGADPVGEAWRALAPGDMVLLGQAAVAVRAGMLTETKNAPSRREGTAVTALDEADLEEIDDEGEGAGGGPAADDENTSLLTPELAAAAQRAAQQMAHGAGRHGGVPESEATMLHTGLAARAAAAVAAPPPPRVGAGAQSIGAGARGHGHGHGHGGGGGGMAQPSASVVVAPYASAPDAIAPPVVPGALPLVAGYAAQPPGVNLGAQPPGVMLPAGGYVPPGGMAAPVGGAAGMMYPGVHPAATAPVPSVDQVSSAFSSDPSVPARPAGEVTRMFGMIPPAPPAPPRRTAMGAFNALPVRTRVMLYVTTAAACVMIIVLLRPQESAPRAPTAPRLVEAPEAHDPLPRWTPPLSGPPAAPTGTLFAASRPPALPAQSSRGGRSGATPAAQLTLPERLAADAVIQGRVLEAIQRYDALALANPDTAVYHHFATVLRRRLEAQRGPCPPEGGPQCAPAAPPPRPQPLLPR